MTNQQIAMIRNGIHATAIRAHGLPNSRSQAVAMYREAADLYGISGNDWRHCIGWCLAQSGYGGGF